MTLFGWNHSKIIDGDKKMSAENLVVKVNLDESRQIIKNNGKVNEMDDNHSILSYLIAKILIIPILDFKSGLICLLTCLLSKAKGLF